MNAIYIGYLDISVVYVWYIYSLQRCLPSVLYG